MSLVQDIQTKRQKHTSAFGISVPKCSPRDKYLVGLRQGAGIAREKVRICWLRNSVFNFVFFEHLIINCEKIDKELPFDLVLLSIVCFRSCLCKLLIFIKRENRENNKRQKEN